jgi:hypothetical protein
VRAREPGARYPRNCPRYAHRLKSAKFTHPGLQPHRRLPLRSVQQHRWRSGSLHCPRAGSARRPAPQLAEQRQTRRVDPTRWLVLHEHQVGRSGAQVSSSPQRASALHPDIGAKVDRHPLAAAGENRQPPAAASASAAAQSADRRTEARRARRAAAQEVAIAKHDLLAACDGLNVRTQREQWSLP